MHGAMGSAAIHRWFIATGGSSVPLGPGPPLAPDDEDSTIDVPDAEGVESPDIGTPAFAMTTPDTTAPELAKPGATEPGAPTNGTAGRRLYRQTPTRARAPHVQPRARRRPWMAATSGVAIILVLFVLVRLAGSHASHDERGSLEITTTKIRVSSITTEGGIDARTADGKRKFRFERGDGILSIASSRCWSIGRYRSLQLASYCGWR